MKVTTHTKSPQLMSRDHLIPGFLHDDAHHIFFLFIYRFSQCHMNKLYYNVKTNGT